MLEPVDDVRNEVPPIFSADYFVVGHTPHHNLHAPPGVVLSVVALNKNVCGSVLSPRGPLQGHNG